MSTYRFFAARTELLRTRRTVHQARRSGQCIASAASDGIRAARRRLHDHHMSSFAHGHWVGGGDATNGIAAGLRTPRARPVQVHLCTSSTIYLYLVVIIDFRNLFIVVNRDGCL